MMIKQAAKKYIPIKYFDTIRGFINRLNFFSYVFYDYKHLIKFRKNKYVKISDIIRQYHRVEKSLSKIPYNSKRGYRAAYTLVNYLEKYETENEIKDVQFYVGLKVLHQFFLRNKDYNSETYKRLKKFKDYNKNIRSGIESTPKSYFIKNSIAKFDMLAESRKSIRYFSNEKVDISLIKRALDISKKTPSVCNRQGWHTWVVSKANIIDYFRKVHNGFTDENQNLTTILIMTFDKNAFDYPIERNQGFTDAGLYSMSVMYSLTHLGLASCPLNSNLLIKDKKNLKKIIGIPDNYTIVMFIAVGNYLEDNISPISYRYPVKDKATFL
ncbi:MULTISPECIES: nitroreductase family protein [Flavobacteriaceae]|uniref:nitroreductase family protein n=1 Tax=Flavobacteriaceae TaxID=49546 RepID=UPI003AA97FD7